jgi:uncharacterized protein (DUF58 family)
MFFLLTFGIGFAALNTGNNLLYLVLALMLAFLVLSGVLSESALRGIAVQRDLPREIFAATPSSIGLHVTNRQRRVPSFAVVIEDRVVEGDGAERAAGRVFVLRVGSGQTETRGYRFTPAARGPLRFSGFLVYTRFPFGLFTKALRLEATTSSLAYPAIEPVHVPADFGGARERGESVSGARGGGALVASLRDYEPGDPVRRIHWPSSLRRGELLVREVESEQEAEVEVRLSTHATHSGERFERSVRWAASEAAAFLEAGARVALRTDATHIPAAAGLGQRGRLLGFLARVQPDGLAGGTP